MMLAIALAALAAVLATAAPGALRHSRWMARSPRAGVTAWVLTVAAMSASVVGAGVAATTPLLQHLGGMREFVHRCPLFAQALRAHLPYVLFAAGGLLLVVAVIAVSLRAILRQIALAREVGARQAVAVAASGTAREGFSVLPAAEPAAWSVAAGGGRVVLTDSAVARLDDAQLQAVLAHERAHLRGRHHLIGTLMAAAAVALPCALTRAAASQATALLEMRADDVAARWHGADVVASALLTLTGAAPTGGLGAGGTAIRDRLDRLFNPPVPARWRMTVLVATAGTGLVAPAALVGLALTKVVDLHVCPLPT